VWIGGEKDGFLENRFATIDRGPLTSRQTGSIGKIRLWIAMGCGGRKVCKGFRNGQARGDGEEMGGSTTQLSEKKRYRVPRRESMGKNWFSNPGPSERKSRN